MAVAAAEWTERIADFSSRGPEVEITAPGRYIVGPWAGYTFDDYVVAGSNDKYICASGTSAATPHVAACACLLKQWYPVLSNLDVRTWLCEHARDL
jgi:subtilisin family serine protease